MRSRQRVRLSSACSSSACSWARARGRVLVGACSWARARGRAEKRGSYDGGQAPNAHDVGPAIVEGRLRGPFTRDALELSGGRQARGRKASSTLAGARSVGGLCVRVRVCVCVIWLVCEGENPWALLGDYARDAVRGPFMMGCAASCMWGGTRRAPICNIHSRGKGVERVGSECFLQVPPSQSTSTPSVIAFTVSCSFGGRPRSRRWL